MNDRVADPSLLAPTAGELLRLYRPGAGVFASPERSVLSQGVHAVLPDGPADTLVSRARRLLDDVARSGAARPLLLGAVPFRTDRPARLFVPDGVVFGHGVERMASPRAAASPQAARAARAQPSPEGYCEHVRLALERIRAGELDKVVLSRSLDVDACIDRPALIRKLMARNPLGYTFAVDLDDAPGGRTLMGASPELLLARKGVAVRSHPLAGSVPRAQDPAEDQARGEALLASAKDLHEHAIVVDAVARRLAPRCRALDVPARPSLVSTPTMWHLGTRITGELRDPAESSLALALDLHPTPAVCGHPARHAHDFINRTEGFDRRFFAGLVGWCDADGDGEWAVTIRCAEIDATSATLYAGAGIVEGSDPALELRETTAKLRTMLNAMNLELAA
ncbi:isochorismate synthase [Rhizobacter sp. LjRoot28]|jgi:isochorismate synthase|uniref:isochorismate synthase n=1 Tax=Rhizobacter sp. LjRoot28 TaxID=3342309 RepID=UPI003ED14617